MAFNRLLLLAIAILALRPLPRAQTPGQSVQKIPELKLEVIPLKRTYTVGEIVYVRYKLTSLADGTLCFPQPSPEAQHPVTGYFETDITARDNPDEQERFIEHYWEGFPSDETLRSDVTSRWIKLGMSEPYSPRRPGSTNVKVTAVGEWILKSTYHPPRLNARQKSIVESLGCSPPDAEVHSDPVTFTVLSAPK